MNVLIVDDHPLFGDGLAALIESTPSPVRVERADSCDAAIAIIAACADRSSKVDLVLLDLTLRDTSGIETLRRFRSQVDSVPVVVVTAERSTDCINACLDLGAMGYVPKTFGRDELMLAVRKILAGQVYVPEGAADVSRMLTSDTANKPRLLRDFGLTPRQIEVFRGVIQGKPNKIISRELGISESTIKKHVSPVLRALGVTDRVQALVALAKGGILIE